MNTETTNPNVSEMPVDKTGGDGGASMSNRANPVENVSGVELAGEVTELIAERDQLVKEKADLQDRVLRLQAEFDNFRRRNEKDKSEFAQYAGMEVIREVLPVLDDFDRALKSNPASPDFVKGVEIIYSRMADTLKKLGLEAIDTTGAQFDPHIHQAVEKYQTAEVEDHTILSDFQRGYKFKGKLLRPSMVKVAVRPS